MTSLWPGIVYILCLLTSTLCAVLLFRAWLKGRKRLLLWTAVGFAFLSLNNLALAADMLVFLRTSLWLFRLVPNLLAVSLLLYAFIWEADR